MRLFKILFAIAVLLTYIAKADEKKKYKYNSYYPDGKIKAITEMIDGKKNGKEELFFENGNIFMIQYFKDDLPVDSFYQYDKDTANLLLFKGFCEPRSHLTIFYADGKTIFGENDYKEKEIGEGFVKVYYDNGNVQSIGEYKDGVRNGLNIIYFNNGRVKEISSYKNGVKIAPIVQFDSSGNVVK